MDVNLLESESFFSRAEFLVQGENVNDQETFDWDYIPGPSSNTSYAQNLDLLHPSEIL
jgi:hypothetical protein